MRSLVISEVAWAGTGPSPYTSDEWIELYNPGPAGINLSAGWKLIVGAPLTAPTPTTPTAVPNLNIVLQGFIPAGGYFLLERTSDLPVTNLIADQIYTGALNNSGDTLYLLAPDNSIVDTANGNGGPWPAGSTANYATMERRINLAGATPVVMPDADHAWMTYGGAPGPDASSAPPPNALIRGTPHRANWAENIATPTITLTPSRTPTLLYTRTPSRTPLPSRTPTPIKGFIVINEILPHARVDFNNDGLINLQDEFIELAYFGVEPLNLRGYRLSYIGAQSKTINLPSKILNPGDKLALLGTETGFILGDSGGTVRLIKSNGQIADAYTYPLVTAPERSSCRLPDGTGLWRDDCAPTFGRANDRALALSTPTPSPTGFPAPTQTPPAPVACLPNAPLAEIVRAECAAPGLSVWNRLFWPEAAPLHIPSGPRPALPR